VRRHIPVEEWKWFGSPGHFIGGPDCGFHLCTLIGDFVVSTVGEYIPQSDRGKKPKHFEQIGIQRTYETMVFRATGTTCEGELCGGCGLPDIIPSDLDFEGYNDAGSATRGHAALCIKWASPKLALASVDSE
jgi:hypothetical protein